MPRTKHENDEFTSASITSLYADGRVVKAESSTFAPNVICNEKVAVICHNITQLHVDAIVVPTHRGMVSGGGAAAAVHFAAGPSLAQECLTLGDCGTGDAKMASAYDLPCKKVIFTVGPKYFNLSKMGGKVAADLLANCYRRSLELAVQARLRSIAFCAIATGAYAYPAAEAAEIALREVRRFLESPAGSNLDRVVFCNYSLSFQSHYKRAIPMIFPPASPLVLPIRYIANPVTTVKTEVWREETPEEHKTKQGNDEKVTYPEVEVDPAKELDWDEISECEYKCTKLNGESA